MADNINEEDISEDKSVPWCFVSLQAARQEVERRQNETSTKYCSLPLDTSFGQTTWNNEECKIQWEEEEQVRSCPLPFDGIPFVLLATRSLTCLYGVRNAPKKEKFLEWRKQECGEEPESASRRGCPAKVLLKEVIKFPDYKIENDTKAERQKWSELLREDLCSGAARPQRRFYVHMPSSEKHVHKIVVKTSSQQVVSKSQGTSCLICNTKFAVPISSAIPLFTGEVRTLHRQLELRSVLSQVLSQEVDHHTTHSDFLCHKCFSLINDIDSLEEQLENKKQMVNNKYKRTEAEINQGRSSPDSLLSEELNWQEPEVKKRGRGRGRRPGRWRGRGGRSRGAGTISRASPASSPPSPIEESCLVKLELEEIVSEDEASSTSITTFKSVPALKTIKKEDIMGDEDKVERMETLEVNAQLLEDEEDEASLGLEEEDVLEVVEEVLEEEVKQEGKLFSCSQCEKQFLTKAAVRNHIKVHDRLDSYDCQECERSFPTKHRLKAHLKTHAHRDRPHICRICQKSFYTRYHLNSHLKNHKASRNFQCEECGKSLASQKTLELHILTHTGEKPYQCEICGSTFRQRSNLLTHIKATHYREKNYHCHLCKKSFVRKRLLVYHMNSAHTGQRPYQCELCGACFVYPHYYKRHLRKHTGDKPHKCALCGKHFATRENRNSHMFIHTDKKPYQCKLCGAGFMRKPLCIAHLNTHNTTGPVESFITFNSPSNLLLASEQQQEQEIITAEDETTRAVRLVEEASVATVVEDPAQLMRDGKVIKVMSGPIHIIEGDENTRYVIQAGDRSRDENIEHIFAQLQGQVVEVRTQDF